MRTKQAYEVPEWLTPGQAAAIVGVSADTIKRYEKRGLIASERTPTGHRRFRREDVEGLLTSAPNGAAS